MRTIKRAFLSIVDSDGRYIDTKCFMDYPTDTIWKQISDYLLIQQPNVNCKVIIETELLSTEL